MKTVDVTFSHAGVNGEPYYRTITNKQLLVVVDNAWHTATDDKCWEEPIGPIDTDTYDIRVVNPLKESD